MCVRKQLCYKTHFWAFLLIYIKHLSRFNVLLKYT